MNAQPEPIATTVAELAKLWNLPFPQKAPNAPQAHWQRRLNYRIPGSPL